MSETDNEKIDNATTRTDSGASDRDTSHHDHGESERSSSVRESLRGALIIQAECSAGVNNAT